MPLPLRLCRTPLPLRRCASSRLRARNAFELGAVAERAGGGGAADDAADAEDDDDDDDDDDDIGSTRIIFSLFMGDACGEARGGILLRISAADAAGSSSACISSVQSRHRRRITAPSFTMAATRPCWQRSQNAAPAANGVAGTPPLLPILLIVLLVLLLGGAPPLLLLPTASTTSAAAPEFASSKLSCSECASSDVVRRRFLPKIFLNKPFLSAPLPPPPLLVPNAMSSAECRIAAVAAAAALDASAWSDECRANAPWLPLPPAPLRVELTAALLALSALSLPDAPAALATAGVCAASGTASCSIEMPMERGDVTPRV